MAAIEKEGILNDFRKADPEGSGIVSKEALMKFFNDQSMSGISKVIPSFVIPGTGGIDYIRFTDWVFGACAWSKAEAAQAGAEGEMDTCESDPHRINQKNHVPVLAKGLQALLKKEAPAQAVCVEKMDRAGSKSSIRRPPVIVVVKPPGSSNPESKKVSSLQARRQAQKRPPLVLGGEVVTENSSVACWKTAVAPEALLTGPMTEQESCKLGDTVTPSTITGRNTGVAPPVQQVAGAADDEFKGILKKEACTGSVLEHFTSLIKDDVFGLPFSVSLALPTVEDTPLIAISEGFLRLTGYSQEDICGRNCRFLLEGVPQDQIQDQTRQESRRYCRAAYLRGLTRLSHTFLIQRNARKSGELFWNLFMLAFVPIPGSQPLIIGLQLDLGPELDLAAGADIASAVAPHEKNLKIVMHTLFGNNMGKQVGPPDDDGDMINVPLRTLASEMGLADDIKKWVCAAEASSAFYQEWGTLPWVIWPMTSKYALLNGGATLLRLEANETPRGGVAMSIFPLKKSRKVSTKMGCSFKIRVDEVCGFEADVGKGAWIPCLGFTELTPSSMDALGGLPALIEFTAKSFVLRGDGALFARSEESHWADGDAALEPVLHAHHAAPYVVNSGDTLECLWGKGFFEVQVESEDGTVKIYKIKDDAIPKPPKTPMYAMIGCCYATCKATLIQ